MVLQGLISKVLQSKQTRGIAFVNSHFQVVGRIKNRQFLSLGHVGIGFTDPVDDFISLENNPETPAPSLRFKFVAGNINDHVFELVDENDLALYIIVAQ